MKQRSLHDFFAKRISTPDSVAKRLELVDETDSDIADDVAELPNDDDEMNVTYEEENNDESQNEYALPKRISFSASQVSEPDVDQAPDIEASSQQQHPWSEDFAPSYSQMYSQQSFCDFSTPQDQPVIHMSHPRSPSPVKKRPRTIPTLHSMPFDGPALIDNETNSEAGSIVLESPFGPSPILPPSKTITPFPEINTNPFAPTILERKRKKKIISPPLWLGASNASKYLSEFVEQEVLGSGSFSKVFKCIKRFDGWTYAIKKSKRHFRSESDKQRALREVHALAALSGSSHIVGYFDAWIEDDLLYIQLEHMTGCSLATFLESDTTASPIPEPTLRKVLAHIAKALRDMHAIRLVHMDVKIDNILKNSDGVYKLGDLGTVVPSDGSMEIMEGDNRYLSRELLEGSRMHLTAGDIFALGATIYELAHGEGLPSSGPEWQKIRDGELPFNRHYSSSLQHLIASMMHPDPLARPSAEDILRHSSLADFNQLQIEHLKSHRVMQQGCLSPRENSLSPRSHNPHHMLLRNLQVVFSNVSRHNAHKLYNMNLRNIASGRTWSIAYAFSVFRALQQNLHKQLCQGHACLDVCPWLFAHVSSNFPKRHLFGAQWPSTVKYRMKYLQHYFANILGVFQQLERVTCPIIGTKVVHLLVDFLYGTAYIINPLESSWFGSSSPRGFMNESKKKPVLTQERSCVICEKSLDYQVDNQVSLTTLPCLMVMPRFSVYYPGIMISEREVELSVEVVDRSMSNLEKKREDKRFHGAFTGGFSAGYYNTVGSKEGWAPSTFQSSRNQPSENEQRKQRIEDFMDEEDDPLLGKRLQLSSQYDPSTHDSQSRKFQSQQAANNPSIPGFIVDDFIQPSRSTIGIALLGKMGWKEGQGVGPKVRKRKFTRFDDTEDNVIFVAPKHNINISDFFPKQKMDKYGAGFDPFVNAPEFGFLKRQQDAAKTTAGQRAIMTFAEAIRGGGNNMGHGLSALEEADDLDIYAIDSKEAFDREISKPPSRALLTQGPTSSVIHDHAATSQVCSDGSVVLEGFALSTTRQRPSKVVLASINVPHNWRPSLSHLKLAPPRKHQTWTASQRGQALGEKVPKGEIQPPHEPTPPPPERQLMHTQFRAGMMAAISSRFQKSSGSTESAVATPAPPKSQPIVRQTRPFMPEKLLCKRFRVAVPDAQIDTSSKPTPSMRFENDILAHVPVGAGIESVAPPTTEELPDLPPLERPPVDLFQSIFDGNSEEDDSSSSSSSEEEIEEKKEIKTPEAKHPDQLLQPQDIQGNKRGTTRDSPDDGDSDSDDPKKKKKKSSSKKHKHKKEKKSKKHKKHKSSRDR